MRGDRDLRLNHLHGAKLSRMGLGQALHNLLLRLTH